MWCRSCAFTALRFVKDGSGGVRLVRQRGLKKLITKAKSVLSEADVRVVAEVAERGLPPS